MAAGESFCRWLALPCAERSDRRSPPLDSVRHPSYRPAKTATFGKVFAIVRLVSTTSSQSEARIEGCISCDYNHGHETASFTVTANVVDISGRRVYPAEVRSRVAGSRRSSRGGQRRAKPATYLLARLHRCPRPHRKLDAGAERVRPGGGRAWHGGHGERSARDRQRARRGRRASTCSRTRRRCRSNSTSARRRACRRRRSRRPAPRSRSPRSRSCSTIRGFATSAR